MNKEFLQALEEIQKEKGIDKEELIAAIETALISAYKKHYGSDEEIVILIDRNVGDVSVFAQKSVSEKEKDALEENEISLEEAKKIKKDAAVGEIIDVQVNPKDFGRIAAQNAKQLVIQKIKESERNIIYNEFFEKQDELISGLVQRKENNNNIIIDLGKTDGVLNVANQIKGEHYYQGMRLKVYVTEVKKTTKGPHIMLSRNHVGLLRRLLELEVPEIYSGDVEVKSIAREAGSRAKVAVFAENENIDPVGSCVGTRGMRIQNIVNELNGEKIDVIEWNADPVVYITAALSPPAFCVWIWTKKIKLPMWWSPMISCLWPLEKKGKMCVWLPGSQDGRSISKTRKKTKICRRKFCKNARKNKIYWTAWWKRSTI